MLEAVLLTKFAQERGGNDSAYAFLPKNMSSCLAFLPKNMSSCLLV